MGEEGLGWDVCGRERRGYVLKVLPAGMEPMFLSP